MSEEINQYGRFRSLRSFFRRGEKKVNIIVDGPNVLRKLKNRQIKVEDIEKLANKLGHINNKFVFLNSHAPERLIDALINSGYTPIICQGDIYVLIAMKALEIVKNNENDILLIASRDARVVPILLKLREKDIETAIVGFNPGYSIALKNIANYAFDIE